MEIYLCNKAPFDLNIVSKLESNSHVFFRYTTWLKQVCYYIE